MVGRLLAAATLALLLALAMVGTARAADEMTTTVAMRKGLTRIPAS